MPLEPKIVRNTQIERSFTPDSEAILIVDLRITFPQKTQFFAKVNHLANIKGVSHCVNYISHWLTPIIILNITIK